MTASLLPKPNSNLYVQFQSLIKTFFYTGEKVHEPHGRAHSLHMGQKKLQEVYFTYVGAAFANMTYSSHH